MALEEGDVLQELWSGYGQIQRLRLSGAVYQTVIAKHISLPEKGQHPRGWNTNLSHQRKVRSYQVEAHFYRHYNHRDLEAELSPALSFRTPEWIACLQEGTESLLLLEDLDAAGYPLRLSSVSQTQLERCLQWLANFHAAFLQKDPTPPTGLWSTGTYWHLATRPDELAALEDAPLQAAAPAIDATLNQARYQTLVHGDAKLANFCFSEGGDQVAALDFQYVGGGCGMKDVAYFLGSCLEEEVLATEENGLLDTYFDFLTEGLACRNSDLDYAAVVSEWRALFPFAWTDFHRFLKGWCPGHWKLNGYSEQMARKVLAQLNF